MIQWFWSSVVLTGNRATTSVTVSVTSFWNSIVLSSAGARVLAGIVTLVSSGAKFGIIVCHGGSIIRRELDQGCAGAC